MKAPKLYTWVCRCRVKYSVLAKDPDLHLLPNRIKCWRLGCRYYMARNDVVQPGPVVRALDLYKTVSGMGSSEERKCGPEELRKLLGKKLTALSIEPASDKDRSLISSFTLEGGITVHLAPSTRGVTVYKVIRE